MPEGTGFTVWFTGLSGAGKSTIADLVGPELERRGVVVADLEMLASGALSPLEGFMGREDYESVLESMRLASGLVWALPVCLAVEQAPTGDRVALADSKGRLYGVLDVMSVYTYIKEVEAERAFGTTDVVHPGVARLYDQAPLYVSGPVTVFDRVDPPFPELSKDPAETRAEFAQRGWK